jgi:hypothetical protein
MSCSTSTRGPDFAMVDHLEKREVGQPTLRGRGRVASIRPVSDDHREAPLGARAKCTVVVEAAGDVATASLLKTFIDETERRVRFLSATVCDSY